MNDILRRGERFICGSYESDLLDARAGLAAATARSVAEEAASSAVYAAAEAASLHITLRESHGNGPDDAISEKLAEYLKQPLPVARKRVSQGS